MLWISCSNSISAVGSWSKLSRSKIQNTVETSIDWTLTSVEDTSYSREIFSFQMRLKTSVDRFFNLGRGYAKLRSTQLHSQLKMLQFQIALFVLEEARNFGRGFFQLRSTELLTVTAVCSSFTIFFKTKTFNYTRVWEMFWPFFKSH